MGNDLDMRLDGREQSRDLAWGRNAIAFIRERDLDGAFNDWCGGWPCPVDTSPATEIGRLVARILEIAPSAGLFAEITIKPNPEVSRA